MYLTGLSYLKAARMTFVSITSLSVLVFQEQYLSSNVSSNFETSVQQILLSIAEADVWQSFTIKGTDTKLKAPHELLPLIIGKYFFHSVH